jgi:CBS domain-containing protein
MSDYLDDEEKIMDEQLQEPSTLSSAIFKKPISDLETPPVIETLKITASIKDAIELMQSVKMGSVIIVDNNEKLVGIVTERDILIKVVGIITDLKGKSISEIMTPNPITLFETDMIAYCINSMHVGGYRHVPIVNKDNKPIALISIRDIVSYVMDHFPEEIINLPEEPFRGKSKIESA